MMLRNPVLVIGLLGAFSVTAAEQVDLSKLPPPATNKIDFARDIKPILENNCLKCHAGDRPKSNFRLTNRENALKGGEHGVDIVPGHSDQSPLIHYVARLVPEMEMPPEGRGNPLSPAQISLLRAWVDQGVAWEPTAPEPTTLLTLAPTVGKTAVSGNEKKFRELFWQPEGWNGGFEYFELTEKPSPDSKITAAGHVLRDDYEITLSAEKQNLGFGRFGWSQFRKYYDDLGGYYPAFSPPAFSLNQDLGLNLGRTWADLGLTLPRWPTIVLGYEYQYRDGTESTLQWGPVSNGGEPRNIFPGFKDISERVHILKLDVDYTVAGVLLSDSFRGEWYKLETRELDESAFTIGGTGAAFTSVREKQSYFQAANTFHLEKQFTDWLFGSGGYLYSKMNADGSQQMDVVNPENLALTSALFLWNAQPIELERESHVFSLSTMLGPWEGLSLTLGIQNEWTRQMGLSLANVSNVFVFGVFDAGSPETLSSDLDRRVFAQEAGLRFTKIPFTTLYADARFQREDLGQFEEEINGPTPYLRNTDSISDLTDLRAGFNTSPWRRVSLTAQYRRYYNATDYSNQKAALLTTGPGTFTLGPAFEGYPAFIRWRDLLSNEAQVKLAVQLSSWLKTSLSYQWLGNDYHTETDPVTRSLTSPTPGDFSPGGRLLAGTYESHAPSINATITPLRRLFLSTSFTWQNARTVSQANDSPSIAAYAGNIYSTVLSGNYALNDKTSLVAGYAFSFADFSQANQTDSIPLGIKYHQHALQAGLKRQINKSTTLGLQYRFFHYDEPTSGTLRNFDAHAAFATLVWRLP